MFELLKTYRRPLIILLIAFIVILGILIIYQFSNENRMMGGFLHVEAFEDEEAIPATAYLGGGLDGAERFQRPSSGPAINLKYPFKDIDNPYGTVPVFQNPEDLLFAYYGILKDASNMNGYQGGCGTIGDDKLPYAYAYKLTTPKFREGLSLRKYVKSFEGTGHTTLLKLHRAYSPPETPDSTRFYMAEIEVVTGPRIGGTGKKAPQPGYFAYYYGLIAAEQTGSEGWKIKRIDYIPEDFLCAPYHGWSWEGSAVVATLYQNRYGLIEKIDRTETHGDIHTVYGSGKGTSYRFDFIQLTNGTQVLLHEYDKFAGQWRETNILKDKDQVFKLSALNPAFK